MDKDLIKSGMEITKGTKLWYVDFKEDEIREGKVLSVRFEDGVISTLCAALWGNNKLPYLSVTDKCVCINEFTDPCGIKSFTRDDIGKRLFFCEREAEDALNRRDMHE